MTMKHTLLFLMLVMASFSLSAQYIVQDLDGNPIEDGDVISFGTVLAPDAFIKFKVTNQGATAINTRIEFVSASNADGSQFELCYGLCYTGLTIGESYPPGSDFIVIEPGMSTGQGNHFYNADAGDGTQIIDYVFRFYETDGSGTDIGNSLTFTYRYDPVLGVNDNQLKIAVASTVISGELAIDVQEDLALAVYDLNGRVVKNIQLEAGQRSINMSDLSAQMYMLHFTNNKGVSQVTKVIVK